MNTRTLFAFATTICFLGGGAAAQSAAPAAGQSNPTGATPAKPTATPAKPAVRKPPSPVDQVIQLVKTGMSESLIVKSLQQNAKPVALTPGDLLRLQEAGVSENIIAAMMDPSATTAIPPAPLTPKAMAVIAPAGAPAAVPVAPPAPPEAPVSPVAAPATPRVKPANVDWRSAIQQRIEMEYPLTQPTGDRADIVSAGAVLVLKKNSLVMYSGGSLSNANTYKGGKLSAGFFGAICKTAKDGSCRIFVKGEKFWLTDVSIKDDGLVLQFLSDPLPDARYSGVLKFPFTKGTQPTSEEMAALVGEVIGLDATASPRAAAPPPPAASQQAFAPIAPPPPPPDQPATPPPPVSIGETKDQVVTALGQPLRTVNAGTRQILYFNNLKVTLVSGKVTDVR